MEFISLLSADFIGLIIGLLLTISVFSYLLGDNVLFRIALYIFVGASTGYVVVIIWHNIVWPKIILPIININSLDSTTILYFMPLLLGILLLFKLVPGLRGIGSPVMAYLVGVGAAVAIGGAVLGTLLPQVSATTELFDFQDPNLGGSQYWLLAIESFIILAATISTLLFFQFTARRNSGDSNNSPTWIDRFGKIGEIFIAITFGAIFARILIAVISVFSNHWSNVINIFLSYIEMG